MTPAVDVTVRAAERDDVVLLSEAHRLAQAAVADVRGGNLDTLLRGRGEPIEATFEHDLETPEHYVWVGTADGLVVGYCVLRLQQLRSKESLGVVTDLWVHPKARGIGVGYSLMREATDTATEKGCSGIDARALPGDRETKNFFESFGLVARVIDVHKSLP